MLFCSILLPIKSGLAAKYVEPDNSGQPVGLERSEPVKQKLVVSTGETGHLDRDDDGDVGVGDDGEDDDDGLHWPLVELMVMKMFEKIVRID